MKAQIRNEGSCISDSVLVLTVNDWNSFPNS